METLSRKCQIDAFCGITDILRNDAKCITKMFCGTGKSRIIREVILNQNKDMSIIVFPSLALIRQYTNDYLQTIQSQKSHKILNISSEILDDFTSTTDPLEIRKFLKLKRIEIGVLEHETQVGRLQSRAGGQVAIGHAGDGEVAVERGIGDRAGNPRVDCRPAPQDVLVSAGQRP